MVREGWLRFIAATQAVVTVGTSLAHHQLCQILFGKDGSIYVQFPYFKRRTGIVSEVRFEPGAQFPTTVSLTDQGKVTSHLVKFTHHTSGEVLLSQTGRVRTEIRRMSFPLAGPIGRVFELHAYWLSGFEPLERGKAKSDRPYLPFVFRDIPFAVVVSAQWRRKRAIEANFEPTGGVSGPVTSIIHRRTGERLTVFFLGQPLGCPLQNHVLMVGCAEAQLPENLDHPMMLFLGGWDPHESLDSSIPVRQTGCLAFVYPVDSPEELVRRIGSIDLQPR